MVKRGQAGLTYLGVLLAVALLGTALAATGVVWRTARQSDDERELLFVGNQFRRAIGLYYQQTPGPAKRYPPSLEALLKDERFPNVQRYLRRIYPDPLTNRPEWGLVMAPEGGIAGVYSLSPEIPRKQANFSPADQSFEGAARYSDWRFVYQPGAGAAEAAPVTAPAAPTH